ncbi:MAG: hypothetical protein ABSG53_11905 [Thermoguttaceae bacterium]|jgi:hypothetical protein
MRVILAATLFLAGFSVAQAQDALPREEALKAAFQLCRQLPKMLETPIPTDPDVKRPVGVCDANRGLMILPESKLSLHDVADAEAKAAQIGQLWMLRVVPNVAGQPASTDRLRMVDVNLDQEDVTAVLCALAVRKGADGKPELLIYGKEKEPLLHVALTKISEKQENPIEVSAERQGDTGTVTLKILGKYTANFTVGANE